MRYTREDACRAWLTYSGLKASVVRKLMEEYGGCSALYDRFLDSGYTSLNAYLTPEMIQVLRKQADKNAMHDMLVIMQAHDMGIMGMDHPDYPDSLRQIDEPPALMFYRGNTACLRNRCVTMVGSRKASNAGVEASVRIGRELSQAGVSIVSGMAMGIDSASILGCLEGGSPAIGVMACGLDVNYPNGGRKLRETLLQQGGILLSEYPPKTPALAFHFRVRNRIIAGLGKVLLMMEASIKSGTMLTVHHALDQGKDVYAYPGVSGTAESEGAHQLLREGALFFSSSKDILEDTKWDAPKAVRAAKKQSPSAPAAPEACDATVMDTFATTVFAKQQPSAQKRTEAVQADKKKLPEAPAPAEKTDEKASPKATAAKSKKTSRRSKLDPFPTDISYTMAVMEKVIEARKRPLSEKEKALLKPPEKPARLRPEDEKLLQDLSPLQFSIYRLMDDGEKSFDELAEATGLNAHVLLGALSMLQLTRLVTALPGKLYRQIHDDLD